MRKKYENKTTFGRIFHKYTGFIIMGVFLSIAVPSWIIYDSNQVFFESWPCASIDGMDITKLTDIELIRYHEIVSECQFTP